MSRATGTSHATTSCVYCKRTDNTPYDVCPSHRVTNNLHFYHCRVSQECQLLKRYGLGAFEKDDNDYIDRIYKSFTATQPQREEIREDIISAFSEKEQGSIKDRFQILFDKWDPNGKFKKKSVVRQQREKSTKEKSDKIPKEELDSLMVTELEFGRERRTRSFYKKNEVDVVSTNTIMVFCPISKELMTKPVRNESCGHVYESSSITELISISKKKDGACCPVVGCSDWVQIDTLKKAKDVLIEIQKRMNAGDKDVLDAVDIDNVYEGEVYTQLEFSQTNDPLELDGIQLQDWTTEQLAAWININLNTAADSISEVVEIIRNEPIDGSTLCSFVTENYNNQFKHNATIVQTLINEKLKSDREREKIPKDFFSKVKKEKQQKSDARKKRPIDEVISLEQPPSHPEKKRKIIFVGSDEDD
ncbi:E3 SUMO-protein ligase [Acrasis kona]|uniref:E3 SUMO-protein ligase n=1 Tax=Acrasis kona TaxID=1008807 RepID=A0AAW2ZA78_9EUKA